MHITGLVIKVADNCNQLFENHHKSLSTAELKAAK